MIPLVIRGLRLENCSQLVISLRKVFLSIISENALWKSMKTVLGSLLLEITIFVICPNESLKN